jgi:hypothetical protein
MFQASTLYHLALALIGLIAFTLLLRTLSRGRRGSPPAVALTVGGAVTVAAAGLYLLLQALVSLT